LRGACIALKGQNEIAQGNALGKWPNKTPSPERATYTALGTQSIALASLNSPFQGLFDGEWLPGVALRLTPGYPYFAPLGLKSRKKVAPFNKLRDRSSFDTVSELAELADISCTRVKDTAWVIKANNGTPYTGS